MHEGDRHYCNAQGLAKVLGILALFYLVKCQANSKKLWGITGIFTGLMWIRAGMRVEKGTACESSHGHYGLMGPASWNSSATEGTVEQDTGSTALTTLYRPYTPVVKEDPPVPGYFIHLSYNQRKKTGSLRERPAWTSTLPSRSAENVMNPYCRRYRHWTKQCFATKEKQRIISNLGFRRTEKFKETEKKFENF